MGSFDSSNFEMLKLLHRLEIMMFDKELMLHSGSSLSTITHRPIQRMQLDYRLRKIAWNVAVAAEARTDECIVLTVVRKTKYRESSFSDCFYVF